MTASMPPLSERQKPPLSVTLDPSAQLFPWEIHPNVCQSCGEKGVLLHRWRECDEYDKPTMTVVVLCVRCEKKLIEPHPRLYIPLDMYAPFPGIMRICLDCPRRSGVSCTSPLAKHNGGRGVRITGPRPTQAHIKAGGGRGGWIKIYSGEATDCAGKQESLAAAAAE